MVAVIVAYAEGKLEGKLGTSMISFVKWETEISHNLPNSTGGLVFL